MAVHRELTFEDYVAILRRRRKLLIIPAILGAAAGYLLSLVLPSRYTSHTMVLVEQPVVPDSYVKPVVSEDLNQRLASMQEQILSRTRLQQLIEEFDLYPKDAKRMPMEALVERLRKSIVVTPINPMQGTRSAELPGFNVDVTLGNARLAQKVCTEITSKFREQNLALRQKQAEDTTQFLAKQLEEAKAKLDEQDAKLAAFQSRYMGELPDDEKTNLALLSGMTPRLQAATQALDQARQEKAFTESLLNQQLASLKSSGDGKSPEALEEQLRTLQKQLAGVQGHYTEEHPDVLKVKRDIAALQKKIQDTPAQVATQSNDRNANLPSIETPEVQQLRAKLHQEELSISQRQREQEGLERQIKTLQGRIELSPLVQQEFKSLTRDHQTALDFYNELLKRRDESQMATDLERRQQGQQFRVLDPPSLPERPSFPNRPLFTLGGLGAGFALGLGLVQLSELRDKSMRTKQDIEFYLGVPALALIPSIDKTARNRKGVGGKAVLERMRVALRASS
jgi:polysaccharide chain length determinant protein (PEP-CTERM system associated)